MSLRTQILTQALPLVASHSFTRQALALALRQIQPNSSESLSESNNDGILDTLFGDGSSGPRALVQRWQAEGVEQMSTKGLDKGKGKGKAKNELLYETLKGRLEYSSSIGEHLVEGYALLSSPSSSTSIPIPTLPLPLRQLLSIKLPPIYSPPGAMAFRSASTLHDVVSKISESTGGRLPLLSVNPFGPFLYGWEIANQALNLQEMDVGVQKGVMNEPVGAGPEWYAHRLSVTLSYLNAEAELLQPYPRAYEVVEDLPAESNPHLPKALSILRRNLGYHTTLQEAGENMEKGSGAILGYLEFVGRGFVGLLRNRYL